MMLIGGELSTGGTEIGERLAPYTEPRERRAEAEASSLSRLTSRQIRQIVCILLLGGRWCYVA